MSIEQQQRLFDACLEASEAERERLLLACFDPQLREQVRSLLRANDSAELSSYPLFAEAEFPRIAAPHQIGPYRILESVGEGAMGDVYLAEQQSPVRRRVALKIIKFGLASREVIARFEMERQTLALLTHQNIARIYDAGATEDGRPYFAMEYVPGIPITRYCDERKLNVVARLELFAQVCIGVQHAHLRGVIHRDLKPTNILVAEIDGSPIPKIIDFGIAKATTSSNAEEVYTRFGNLLGTPEYMSPEQAQLSPLDIDARTDVYSLGIVLYELLTGSRPYTVTGNAMNPAVVLNEIVNREVKRPSDAVANGGAEARAELRGQSSRSLADLLRDDLDWIVLKALQKNRQHRYESPAALADDLRRYANHEPVTAGPPSTSYRLRKFVRRHRIGVSVVSALFVAAIVFGSAMTWLAIVASQQRDRANEEAQVARRVTAFTAGLFELANPANTGSSNTSARELLDLGVRRLETQAALERPEVRAALLDAAGKAYRGLGVLDEAERLFRAALTIRDQDLSLSRELRADTLVSLADIKGQQGSLSEAETLAQRAIDLLLPLTATNGDALAQAQSTKAEILRRESKLDEAAAVAEQASKNAASVPLRRLAMQALGSIRKAQGRLDEAERLLRELYEEQQRNEGPHAETTLATKNDLANVYETMGKSERAEPLLRELVDDMRKIYGEQHAAHAVALNDLANAISDMPEKRAEAEQLYLRAIDIMRPTLGAHHPEVGNTYNNLGALYVRTEQWRKADEAYQQAIAIRSSTLGPRHPETASSMHGRGLALIQFNRLDEAEKLMRESLSIYTESLGAEHWRTGNVRVYLGFVLAKRGHREVATKEMREGYRLLVKSLGADHWRVERANALFLQMGMEL